MRDFGENYLQEALDKQAELSELPLVWHFIGPIQSNKTKSIAEHFDWVHSVDRLKIAQRLSDGEEQIVAELLGVQGSPADIGGYYRPEDEKAFAVMRPSATLNEAIDSLKK